MKNSVFALSFILIFSTFLLAQSSDFNKAEFYGGYSNGQVDMGNSFPVAGDAVHNAFQKRANFNGFEVAAVYNIGRYVGIKGDVSGTYHTENFSFPATTGTTTQTVSGKLDGSLHNFLGGVQFKDNAKRGRFKPFAHALFGVSYLSLRVKNLICTDTASVSCINFSAGDVGYAFGMAFGGGLDVRLNNKVDIRAIQVDYNPAKANGFTDNNIRFGVGVVIK